MKELIRVQQTSRKSSTVAYLLALFLGGLGLHHFYFGRYIRGGVYFVFVWTYIPFLLGWIDMFFIKKWTEEFNKQIGFSNKDLNGVSHAPTSRSQRITEVTDKSKFSSSINDLFYNEEIIILPKYENLITPHSILESVQNEINPKLQKMNDSHSYHIEINYSSSGKDFIKKSVKYAKKGGVKVPEIPLQAYWTTFNDLDNKKLKWYLYWRTEVLKENYIDVDLSYIFVFVYELLNYSFNQKAAFNVSALVRIYENYREMHPKLENYLPRWIKDMLNELDEEELANEWNIEQQQPLLYKRIATEEMPLDKISITNWKPYLRNYRETVFFTKHKNKIYKTFKLGAALLGEYYKRKGEKIEEVWFEMKRKREVTSLYSTAVIGREIRPIHIYTNQINTNEIIYNQVTALFRLSENIIRESEGEKRRIKVDNGVLPENFQDLIMARVDERPRRTNERFIKVQSKESTTIGSVIPKPPEEASEPRTIISFNTENITRLSNESVSLQNIFTELESTSDDKDVQMNPENNSIGSSRDSELNIVKKSELEKPVMESYSNNNLISSEHEINTYFSNLDTSEDKDGFIKSLSTIEKEFIKHFEDSEMAQKDATLFLKQKGQMLGSFLIEINEKANDYLGDNIFEVEQEKIIIYEEFTFIIEILKGA